jgi:GNAT superfamily N-acetyltransferase
MFVRADWTRRGLGRAILEACEAAARTEGFTSLSLMATLPGVALYAHHGFVVTQANVPVRTPDGVVIACAAMEKPL